MIIFYKTTTQDTKLQTHQDRRGKAHNLEKKNHHQKPKFQAARKQTRIVTLHPQVSEMLLIFQIKQRKQ